MTKFEEALNKFNEYGTVVQVRQSLALVRGLPGAVVGELIYFDTDAPGLVHWLSEDDAYITLLTNELVRPGQRVARSGRPVETMVGSAQRGQVVTPLGDAALAGVALSGDLSLRPIDQPAPPLEARAQVNKPLPTGSTVVDMLVPLAAGQREAVFGDQKTGKTSFLLSTAKAHAARGGMVVYALIGRPGSDIKRVYEFLRNDPIVQQNVVIVVSQADDVPSLIALTPFSAMTIAEYWRDAGHDVLLILHDLSTHAKFHREVALVAGQFPGRDSYPGNIFHEHARLLERAGNFTVKDHGDVSITCLPVVETVEEDLASYIVSNIISITDGHLMFDRTYYSQGQRPAVRAEASVTRVGLKAQSPLLKQFHRQLLAFLDTYNRAGRFSHFGAELSAELKYSLLVGSRLTQLFTQSIFQSVTPEVQLVMTAMVQQGWFNELELEAVGHARDYMLQQVESNPAQAELLTKLTSHTETESFLAQLEHHKEALLALCQTPITLPQT